MLSPFLHDFYIEKRGDTYPKTADSVNDGARPERRRTGTAGGVPARSRLSGRPFLSNTP